MRRSRWLLVLAVVSLAEAAASCPAAEPKPLPPPGIKLDEADRQALAKGLAELNTEVAALRKQLAGKPALDLLPDVIIFENAVRYSLEGNQFYNAKDVVAAKDFLTQGRERARQLREGQPSWTTATGLVVRGYESKIDGSVQPYGLVVPAGYRAGVAPGHRIDIWLHGRSETLSEVNFIYGRQRAPGEFTPTGALVLHPYGRYCNASKFAGEIDVFEALDHVRRHYSIDDNRVVLRGFSMGGASTWHLATHYADRWVAAAPGAGFAETGEYLNIVKNDPVQPTWYQKRLWHLYDATEYALNLFNCPTVAYSGEDDAQKQAADIMARYLKAEGIEMTHIIGPKTGHKYHPEAKLEVARRVDEIAARGRNPVPGVVRFVTWTLRYNQMYWVTVDSLAEHWQQGRVEARIASPTAVEVATKNVTALTLAMPAGGCPLDETREPQVRIDGQSLTAPRPESDRSWTAHFRKTGNSWALVTGFETEKLAKRHGLQGPIDDAFFDSFLMVRPSGKPASAAIGVWAAAEMEHATSQWQKIFRGTARQKDDRAVTDDDIAKHNLVLWGDPSSNAVLAKIADKLPIRWTGDKITVGAQSFPAATHVPVMIYPNPLNPKRYVVLNSSFTFREADHVTNARQIPRLPDWAVVDTRIPHSQRGAAEVVAADFFDEAWQLSPPRSASQP